MTRLRTIGAGLSKGSLTARMNKLTSLDNALRGFGGIATGGRLGDAAQRRQFAGRRDLGDERRHLFGVGEGPAEAAAKHESIGLKKRRQFVKKFVSEQWILSCKSLGRSLVYHL